MKAVLPIILIATSALAGTAEWPGWRGDGTGISAAKDLALTWSDKEHVKWSASVPGYGWSSPVVAGDRVYLTTAITAEQQPPARRGPGGGEPALDKVVRWEVHCLDRATGRTLWKQVAAEHKPAIGNHISNTFASETPVTDGECVIAYFGMAGIVVCYDLAGKLVWTRDLGAHKTFGNWGTGSSPAFDGERVFIQGDNEEKSFLVALDKKTGKDVWREARTERTTWGSPVVWRNAKRTEIVLPGSGYFRSYDPATGRELWRLASERSLAVQSGAPASSVSTPVESRRPPGGGSGGPPPKPGDSGNSPARGPGSGGDRSKAAAGGCKSSPLATRDMIYLSCAPKSHSDQLGPMWAVKAGASGDISLKPGATTSDGVAWFRFGAGSHFSSAAADQESIYVFPPHGRGVLSCFDAKTGATIYEGELPGGQGFKASPCIGDAKIFCTDEAGTTFVVEAGPKFKLLGKNSLGEMSWASPAIAANAIFLRTTDHLFCISK